jgi:hypothetical protein
MVDGNSHIIIEAYDDLYVNALNALYEIVPANSITRSHRNHSERSVNMLDKRVAIVTGASVSITGPQCNRDYELIPFSLAWAWPCQ